MDNFFKNMVVTEKLDIWKTIIESLIANKKKHPRAYILYCAFLENIFTIILTMSLANDI